MVIFRFILDLLLIVKIKNRQALQIRECKKKNPRKLSVSKGLVDDTGLEPVTPCTSSRCSSQLS